MSLGDTLRAAAVEADTLEVALADCQQVAVSLRQERDQLINQVSLKDAEIAALNVENADLLRRLQECEASDPPESRVLLGIWPGGRDIDNLADAEAKMGRLADGFRERGGHGTLDTPLYRPRMLDVIAGGRQPLLELNCRLGPYPGYIPFTRVLSGEFDAHIRDLARQAKALPGGPFLFEMQSEANLSKHDSGTPEQYKWYCRRIRGIFEAQGVTNILYTCSLTRAGYRSFAEADRWIDPEVIDVVAVDGYSVPTMNFGGRSPGIKRSMGDIADECLAYARSLGKPMAVCEVGCQEDLVTPDPDFKANFYRGVGEWVRSNASDVLAVVFNTSDDGPGGFDLRWHFDSSPQSLEAFRELAASSFRS